jgi:hypothetical protein
MRLFRDKSGKTRVAKGDRSGLGGQYAPDPIKIKDIKRQAAEMRELAALAEKNDPNLTPRERCKANPWNCKYEDYGTEIDGWGTCLTHGG